MTDEQTKDEAINDARYNLGVYIENINEEIDKAKQCIAQQEEILSTLKLEYARFDYLKRILDGGAENETD